MGQITWNCQGAKHKENVKRERGFLWHSTILIKLRQRQNKNQLSFGEKPGGSLFIVVDIDHKWCLFANSKARIAKCGAFITPTVSFFSSKLNKACQNLFKWEIWHQNMSQLFKVHSLTLQWPFGGWKLFFLYCYSSEVISMLMVNKSLLVLGCLWSWNMTKFFLMRMC